MSIDSNDDNSKKEKQAYDLSNFKVLVADDFRFICDLVASTLNEMGIGRVWTALNGIKAKEKLLQYNLVQNINNIDVLLLDWLMPEMDGETLLKWIRSHSSDTIKFLPVIVCSAYTSSDLVEKARDMGANEVMVKPVSAEKLAHRIQHVIENPRPYIKSPDFFGPDRRRKEEKYEGDEKRKAKAEDLEEHHEEIG